MGDWIDVAFIVISCVLFNHMGLISAIEDEIDCEIPIFNCVKCSTFWFVFIYLILNEHNVLLTIATSFLLSYVAIWLELFFGFVDFCYEKIYKKIYKDSKSSTQANSNNEDTEDSESSLS